MNRIFHLQNMYLKHMHALEPLWRRSCKTDSCVTVLGAKGVIINLLKHSRQTQVFVT